MKRFFSLNQEIPAQLVLQVIGEMIGKTVDMGERILVIEIKPVSQEQIMLPLLEHKSGV